METLEKNSKAKILIDCMDSIWPIYLIVFVFLSFGTRVVQTLFTLDLNRYPLIGIYIACILLIFIYHVKRLYFQELSLRNLDRGE